MKKVTDSLLSTLVASALLLVTVILILSFGPTAQPVDLAFLFRWLHVIAGVMWIGLLWYFNFVQIPNLPKIPDEQKPAISKVIAPSALFWFRWGALLTVITGLVLAYLQGYWLDALALGITNGVTGHTAIGIGMWFGLIMAFNVWFLIWPSQKIALGIKTVEGADKAAAAARAKFLSRINTLLSIPMLYCMVAAQSLYLIS